MTQNTAANAKMPMLDLLQRLVAALDQHAIQYCYWRSTLRLPAVMLGNGDLDLLVARGDQHRIASVLLASGFKPFPSVAQRHHPAISSFLGYDEPSGRIVHVHLHAALALGSALLKNYRLPLATALLGKAVPDPLFGIPVMDPASEAVLLLLRACFELRRSDPLMVRNWGGARRKFARDRAALLAEAGLGFRPRAAELLGEPAADLLEDALHAAGSRREAAAFCKVRRALADFRMYGGIEAALRGAARSLHWLAGGLNRRVLNLPRPSSRLAAGGGAVVALMGVDGSGKTTVMAALRNWLGAEIDTVPIYFGTGGGRPSLLLLPLKALVPLFTRMVRTKPRGSSHGAVTNDRPGFAYSAMLMLWATVLSVEKRSKLRAAYRGAGRGLVVVADRFPQDQLPDYNDGPLLPRLPWCPAWLRRYEAKSYALARRLQPDLVLKLQATPDVLASREPTMDRGLIQERVRLLQRLSFPDARVVVVDATMPLNDVIRTVKNEVWSLL